MSETTEQLQALGRLRGLVKSGALRDLRIAAGVSVVEVARVAELSTRTIQRWERGQTAPRGPGAVRYARLLDRLAGSAS